MTFRLNQSVQTPYGKGNYEGRYQNLCLVRLPINEITSKHLTEAVTPHATKEGLWAFKESELR